MLIRYSLPLNQVSTRPTVSAADIAGGESTGLSPASILSGTMYTATLPCRFTRSSIPSNRLVTPGPYRSISRLPTNTYRTLYFARRARTVSLSAVL